jgi:teichuronic acid biosynthesis glycosyltransferase TuaC
VSARLLFFSNLFPTATEPYRGLDNATLLHELRADYDIRVISPRPSLPWARKAYAPRAEDEVLQPRWINAAYLPRIGGPVNHALMAASARKAFEEAMRDFKPAVVLSSWIYADSCAAIRLAAGRVPVVAIAQGSDIHQYLGMAARRGVILRTLPRAAAVITRSRELSRILERAGFPHGKLHTIYNGVSLEAFQPRDQAAARREAGLPADGRIVLFVGNFYAVKNPALLIEALAKLTGAPYLVMAGGGPLERECRELAGRLGITSRVLFMGRKMPGEIATLMNAADVLALPSRNEGVPNVILEAFASGLPVVASRVGGIPEVLDQDFLGQLTREGDVDDLARALEQRLAMPRDVAAIRRHGERFSWKAAADAYRGILKAAPNPSPILYHFRTRGTGAEAVHISGIVRAFEKMGSPVILSSPTGIDPRQGAGATPFAEPGAGTTGLLSRLTRRLPGGLFELLEFLYNIPAYRRNLRLACSGGVRLIYERHAFFLFSTALVANRCGCPLVVEVNELVGDPRIRAQPLFSWLARWTDRFVFRRARLIVTVSPHLKRRVEEYGIPPERVIVLPNAVSEAELAVPAEEWPIREVLPQPAFLLGFVGWLVEWHRLDFVIKALAMPEFSNVVLVLIGEGPLQSTLEAQARALGVRLYCAGPLPHARIPAALRAMDACVVPHSNAYRSPIKLFEFMAQARPILAPRTEPIESVAADEKEALLFTPLDINSFRYSLSKLLKSSDLRETIGTGARRAVEQRHTWEGNAQHILAKVD